MNQILTLHEIDRTQQLCFTNPAKACAIAQIIIDTCQVVSCTTYATATGNSCRSIQYKAKDMTGILIENRKFMMWSVKPTDAFSLGWR